MATEEILLSDGTDQGDKSVIHTVQESIELGPGDDGFADGLQGWQWTDFGATAGIDEQNGLLECDFTGSATKGYVTNGFDILGDFFVQVDFSSFLVSSGTNNVMAIFRVDDVAGDGVSMWRHKRTSDATDIYKCAKVYNTDPVEIGTTDTQGKFAIARFGEDFVCMYWSTAGSEWVILQHYEGVTSGALKLRLVLRVDASVTGRVYYDNFQFILGGFYITTSPEPNSVPWNTYTTGLSMDMSTIDIFEYGSGSQKYQYAKNNGAYNGSWLTLAQLQAESDFLVTHANSLRIKVQLISTGLQTSGVNRRGTIANDETVSGGLRFHPGMGGGLD